MFKGLVAQTRYLFQIDTGDKGAVLFPVGDDVAGNGGIQAGNACQQRGAGSVHVYPHRVHTVFPHGVQRAGQFDLADVVLVLAHPDGFRVDFHQLGQRVLQTSGDGDCAAEGYVQIGEFAGRGF